MIWTPELLTAAADAFTRKHTEVLRQYSADQVTGITLMFERAVSVPIRMPKIGPVQVLEAKLRPELEWKPKEGQRDVSE